MINTQDTDRSADQIRSPIITKLIGLLGRNRVVSLKHSETERFYKRLSNALGRGSIVEVSFISYQMPVQSSPFWEWLASARNCTELMNQTHWWHCGLKQLRYEPEAMQEPTAPRTPSAGVLVPCDGAYNASFQSDGLYALIIFQPF